jgi:hypothetical protein
LIGEFASSHCLTCALKLQKNRSILRASTGRPRDDFDHRARHMRSSGSLEYNRFARDLQLEGCPWREVSIEVILTCERRISVGARIAHRRLSNACDGRVRPRSNRTPRRVFYCPGTTSQESSLVLDALDKCLWLDFWNKSGNRVASGRS